MNSKSPSLNSLRINRSQAPLKSRNAGIGWIVLILLVAAAADTWWFTRAKAISVKTAIVQVRSATGGGKTLLNASGYVTTRLEAMVSSKITDKVTEILVKEGMKVDSTIIRAPLAGVVTTKDSQPGEMISPMSSGGFTRTGICPLVDMASLESAPANSACSRRWDFPTPSCSRS